MAWGNLREPSSPIVPSRPILSPHFVTACLISLRHVWRVPGMKGFAPESGFEKKGQSRVGTKVQICTFVSRISHAGEEVGKLHQMVQLLPRISLAQGRSASDPPAILPEGASATRAGAIGTSGKSAGS